MLKHKSIVLASYVSPAVKFVKIQARKSMLSGSIQNNSADSKWYSDGEDVHNYEDL